MTLAATFTDAPGAVMRWINSLTNDLVGQGQPLAKGAVLHHLHGARTASYALLSQVGGSAALGNENGDQRARISAQIYGATDEAASQAAAAYANALVTLDGRPVAVQGALILFADNISGPISAPDRDEPRYLVDADVFLRPA